MIPRASLCISPARMALIRADSHRLKAAINNRILGHAAAHEHRHLKELAPLLFRESDPLVIYRGLRQRALFARTDRTYMTPVRRWALLGAAIAMRRRLYPRAARVNSMAAE